MHDKLFQMCHDKATEILEQKKDRVPLKQKTLDWYSKYLYYNIAIKSFIEITSEKKHPSLKKVFDSFEPKTFNLDMLFKEDTFKEKRDDILKAYWSPVTETGNEAQNKDRLKKIQTALPLFIKKLVPSKNDTIDSKNVNPDFLNLLIICTTLLHILTSASKIIAIDNNHPHRINGGNDYLLHHIILSISDAFKTAIKIIPEPCHPIAYYIFESMFHFNYLIDSSNIQSANNDNMQTEYGSLLSLASGYNLPAKLLKELLTDFEAKDNLLHFLQYLYTEATSFILNNHYDNPLDNLDDIFTYPASTKILNAEILSKCYRNLYETNSRKNTYADIIQVKKSTPQIIKYKELKEYYSFLHPNLFLEIQKYVSDHKKFNLTKTPCYLLRDCRKNIDDAFFERHNVTIVFAAKNKLVIFTSVSNLEACNVYREEAAKEEYNNIKRIIIPIDIFQILGEIISSKDNDIFKAIPSTFWESPEE